MLVDGWDGRIWRALGFGCEELLEEVGGSMNVDWMDDGWISSQVCWDQKCRCDHGSKDRELKDMELSEQHCSTCRSSRQVQCTPALQALVMKSSPLVGCVPCQAH